MNRGDVDLVSSYKYVIVLMELKTNVTMLNGWMIITGSFREVI